MNANRTSKYGHRIEPRTGGVTRRQVLGSLIAAAALSAMPAAHALANDDQVSFGKPAAAPVPLDYIGLSYETAQLADPSFFAPDNKELISLFRSLSQQGTLRIGGNSSEFCWWKTSSAEQPPPMPVSAHGQGNWMPKQFTAIEPVAIDHLAGFLHATGWRAIHGLNLGTGTPDRAAEEAAYVARTLGSRLLFFQIGNEPEYYSNANNRLRPSGWDFEQYLRQWLDIAHAVIQSVPHARFGGPDVGSNAEWVVRFAEEAPKALPGRIVACTGHYYAEGPPDSPRTTVERLLTPDLRFEDELDRMTAAAAQANVVYRMTEGNSCYRGGKPGLSDAFCSALWAAEFLLELASHGTAGVNLHGGGSKQIRMSLGGHLPGEQMSVKASAAAAEGSFYTPIAGSRAGGFIARPIFYGMKVAGLLVGGRMLPVHLDVSPVAATAWAAGMPDGSMRVVVLNKDAKQELALKIPSAHRATLWRLEAPSLTATAGVTLAGAGFHAGETWKPLREESVAVRAGAVQVTLPPASGAVILLKNHLA